MIRLISIVGARPQFVKAATVSRAVALYNEGKADRPIEEKLLHTGQHYDENMSKVFFDELAIPRPAYNLEVGAGAHGAQTGCMLERIESVLLEDRPDLVLVYGDTNSTLAGALAAAKLHIPVAHVEAGLRSFVRTMPEEINRVLTDHISSLLFCPTSTAVDNLADEGICQGVSQVGDVMYDGTLFYAEQASAIEQGILGRLGIEAQSFHLATVHRAENTDKPERLGSIFEAFGELSTETEPVVLPLHPRTIKYIREYGLEIAPAVRLIEPVSFLEMVALEKNAKTILTDSGGVQKEAYFLSVPCVTLRDETEWVETVEAGWNTLVGADTQAIVDAAAKKPPKKTQSDTALYGMGDAADRICHALVEYACGATSPGATVQG